MQRRTDLAAEARELWQERAGTAGALPGVEEHTETENGFSVETLRVLDQRGAEALEKPVGTYVTVSLEGFLSREEGAFARAAGLLAAKLRALLQLKPGDSVLVAGLGNDAITPDNLGPKTVRHTLATRHLVDALPVEFGAFRRVAAMETGVLGVTGVESAELVQALVQKVRPGAVIAVDALASRRARRILRTVQLCDAGITPGSGVGNARAELSRRTLGVPVVAVGVPTVVDAGTLAADLNNMANIGEFSPEDFGQWAQSLIVTPREIDRSMDEISRLLGYGINLALHDGLTVADVTALLA